MQAWAGLWRWRPGERGVVSRSVFLLQMIICISWTTGHCWWYRLIPWHSAPIHRGVLAAGVVRSADHPGQCPPIEISCGAAMPVGAGRPPDMSGSVHISMSFLLQCHSSSCSKRVTGTQSLSIMAKLISGNRKTKVPTQVGCTFSSPVAAPIGTNTTVVRSLYGPVNSRRSLHQAATHGQWAKPGLVFTSSPTRSQLSVMRYTVLNGRNKSAL